MSPGLVRLRTTRSRLASATRAVAIPTTRALRSISSTGKPASRIAFVRSRRLEVVLACRPGRRDRRRRGCRARRGRRAACRGRGRPARRFRGPSSGARRRRSRARPGARVRWPVATASRSSSSVTPSAFSRLEQLEPGLARARPRGRRGVPRQRNRSGSHPPSTPFLRSGSTFPERFVTPRSGVGDGAAASRIAAAAERAGLRIAGDGLDAAEEEVDLGTAGDGDAARLQARQGRLVDPRLGLDQARPRSAGAARRSPRPGPSPARPPAPRSAGSPSGSGWSRRCRPRGSPRRRAGPRSGTSSTAPARRAGSGGSRPGSGPPRPACC